MVTGSPGGSTIITSVLQSILNVVDFKMNMQQAVNAPRFHHQWLPDNVVVEAGYLTPDSARKLEAMGYTFRENAPWGALDSILIDPKTGQRQGANDGRRTAGLAAGY
jgi:gamma-glutamyltranspeptidase / glutathione hydrolase